MNSLQPIPIRFGRVSRQLFGLYQPPPEGGDSGRGILLCNPFGQEAIRCHRLFRVLADRLSRNGFHVLRFDYFATGDSDGADADGSLQQWILDVVAANEELVRRSGVTTISWFGLRLGGTIAAMASTKSFMVPERLVLWDPILDGPRYLTELAEAHIGENRRAYGARWKISEPLRTSLTAQADNEALGFPITAGLKDEFRSISPDFLSAVRSLSLEVFTGSANELDTIRNGLPAKQINLAIRPIETNVVWASNEAMNSAIVPAETLQSIAAALAAR